VAANGQQADAPAPKRRAKLGVFKTANPNTDSATNGTVAENADASLQTQEPADAAPAVATAVPAKRKAAKRMARRVEASQDAPVDSSDTSDDQPAE
jgi:hypothetical protein